MSDDTTPPLKLSKERKLTMPLAFVLGLLATTAAGVAAWTSTRGQVDANTKAIVIHTDDIKAINKRVSDDHDILIEMRADLKLLVRDRQK